VFFSGREGDTSKYSVSLNANLVQSIQNLGLGRKFAFQQDNDPKHTAKTMQEWIMDNSVNVFEWPSQSLGLSPIKHLWRNLKMAVHRRPRSNLTELERMSNIAKSSCEKLYQFMPKKLEALKVL